MTNEELDVAISLWRHVDDVVCMLEKMATKHADDMDVFTREKFENLAADAMLLRKDLLIKMSDGMNV